MLKTASFTRSAVGLVAIPRGAASLEPLAIPAITLIASPDMQLLLDNQVNYSTTREFSIVFPILRKKLTSNFFSFVPGISMINLVNNMGVK
jgi:hypothetical protein